MYVKFTLQQAMMTQRGSGSIALVFNLGHFVRATLWLLYSREKRPSTLCTGGKVVFRDGLDTGGKSLSHRDSISGP